MNYIRQYFVHKDLYKRFKESDYAEVSYRDRYEDGTEVEGTEDFSSARFRNQTAARFIYRETGKLNRGGHRIWECIGSVRCRTAIECGKLARAMYPGVKISMRQY